MAQTIALEGIISCSVFHFHEDTLIFRFHELRHTFATTALLNGVDVKTVSSMLGHYSAGFTLDTYTHVTTQMQRAAADKMGGFMENALPGESAPEPEPPKGKIIPFERVG